MTPIPIKKETETPSRLPVFQELSNKMDEIRRRAFELFERRGAMFGNDLDDWIQAEHDVMGWPAAELKEKDSAFEMEVTLPGFDPKEVEVTATPEELVIHAASEKRETREEGKVLWSEFGSNNVYRRFAFPERIDPDAAKAQFDNGMLRVTVPKAAPKAQTQKKIPVTAN